MKKTFSLLIIFLPFSLFAQLNLLHSRMTLTEFHQSFPKAVPDIEAMTASVSGVDTMAGQMGTEEFVISNDTVTSYFFQSNPVAGPSGDFPKADSADYSKMMRSAREMYYHYNDMFGTAIEVKQHSPIVPKKQVVDPNVFYAHWKMKEGEVVLSVHPVVDDPIEMNAPAGKSKKQKFIYYLFEIRAEGKGGRLQGEYEIGATSKQLKTLIPSLATQVKNFPDCWMVHDTLAGVDANWRFWFQNNVLIGFAYDTYNGEAYGKKNTDVYAVLMTMAKKMEADAAKQFGPPETLVSPPTNDYAPLKKIPDQFFYDDLYFNAEWKFEVDNDKNSNEPTTLLIRLHENGGKGPSFFHLEVYYGNNPQ